ncbi:MAG: mevalonate kinase [Planctomycetota bacterium]|jgi:mevalonate kinase
MESAEATACAKAILIGEHAAVYGRPAVAVPLGTLRVKVTLRRGNEGESGILVSAPNLGMEGRAGEVEGVAPLVRGVEWAYEVMERTVPSLTLKVDSAIPVGKGLGSSAAVAVATARAVAALEGVALEPEAVSRIAFRIETLHHGNPSGIDNSVIALERPVFFTKTDGPAPFDSGAFRLVLADSGPAPSTGALVAGVAERRRDREEEYEGLFDDMAKQALEAREALIRGDEARLGGSLNTAHGLLRRIGVSTETLDRLVGTAVKAGALGAKLSGAGGGGYLIALSPSREATEKIHAALRDEGATGLFETRIGSLPE